MDFRKKFAFGNTLILLLTYTLFRAILYFTKFDYFSSLDFIGTTTAFLDGLRFDLSMIFTFVGLPLFLINLPILKKKWMKSLSVIISFQFLVMVLLLAGDVIFFGLVDRHLGEDLKLVADDTGFVVDFAFGQYWYFVLLILLSFTALIFAQFKLIDKYFESKKVKIWKEIIIQILLVIIIIAGIRGTTRSKPLNLINAFSGGSSEYGNLVLNGVFTSYHVNRHSKNIKHNFFPEEKAIKDAVGLIVEPDEIVVDMEYPLSRSRKDYFSDSLKLERPNIVFVLFESWTPDFIDSFSGSNYGVTPNFDSIAGQGLKFVNCYSNGDRSIHAISSSLLGIPQTIGMPHLGLGLELQNILRLGKVFSDNGYATLFTQTSSRGSFRMDVIAAGLGFEEYYGKQDIPIIYDYITDKAPNFGWDYDAFMFMEKKISEKDKPFFAYLFTGTTHRPYILADKKFEKYPHRVREINGYFNSLYYSDWALGQFMAEAKKKPWFDNTIFIFISDHISNIHSKDMRKWFRVPLVIYAPKIFEGKEVDFLCSQADLPATIFDMTGIKGNYSGIGKSLLRDYKNRFVVSKKGNSMFLFDKYGSIRHDLHSIMDYRISNIPGLDTVAVLKEMEWKLLTIDQAVYSLFKKNKLFK